MKDPARVKQLCDQETAITAALLSTMKVVTEHNQEVARLLMEAVGNDRRSDRVRAALGKLNDTAFALLQISHGLRYEHEVTS